MANNQGSAEITELLISAGVELNRLNKVGRSALEESVLSDNIGAMEVLVKAGANTEAGQRLAKTKGKDKVLKYLGHNNIRCEEGIKAEIIRKSDELEERGTGSCKDGDGERERLRKDGGLLSHLKYWKDK